ncbi:protein E6-like [Abrus precatorius]|uniref:Protein E6-like n=1 Tax=Abrus precatorius TaxID=3816 RepID=A0A8B8K5F9_ABRPR|nr:protein E6-like [Abrus precatorius]
MAPYSNYISFLFLTTLLLPLQITARDSQFFSKVTHFNENINNNNVKETEVANKGGKEINKAEQQPVFIPETENSYGLYGHDSNQFPPTTTTTTDAYHPLKTEFEDPTKYTNNKYYNNDAYNTRFAETGYNKYYNTDAYEGNQYELSDTKSSEEGYNSVGNHQNNNNNNQKYYYNNNHNNYHANNNRYSYNNNAANNRLNGEKQGMSDTRFLEGGKYYYDIEAEKYNPTALYGDSASRGVNTHNLYNNRGNNYGNDNYNGYQNQEEFEDEQQDGFQP